MEIKELVKEAYKNASEKGFWEDFDIISKLGGTKDFKDAVIAENLLISTRLMLIVSELGEAQESLRKNNLSNFQEELADVAIRLADLCGGLDIDLEAEIIKKMEKNKVRPYKHGKQF